MAPPLVALLSMLSGHCPPSSSWFWFDHDDVGDGMKARAMINYELWFLDNLHHCHSLCKVNSVHHLALGLGHHDLGDDGMNTEWKIMTAIMALFNGLQIEKVCPTFLNFVKNNHNHHKAAKFGIVWSQSFTVRWDFEQVAVSRVPQLKCIWMSLPAGNGLGNLTSRGFSEVFSTEKAWKSASDDSDPDSCEKSLGWKWIEVVGPYEAWGPVVSPFLNQENGTLCASLTQTERMNCPKFPCFSRPKNLSYLLFVKAKEYLISIHHLTFLHAL